MTEKWTYLHDGGDSKATIEVEEMSQLYTLRLTFSDPTDYARMPYILHNLFKAIKENKVLV